MLLAIVALYIVFFIWYPPPLATATGVGVIFVMLVAIDVAVGPVLTFIVFQPKKKSLKFDVACIIALQASAFFYGLNAIAVARPAWLVFNVDRFDVAQANELDARFLAVTKQEFKDPPWGGPRWVASAIPSDVQIRNQLALESVAGGSDLAQRPDLYMEISQVAEEIQSKSLPLSVLALYNPPEMMRAVLKKWPGADAWLPIKAKEKSMVVLLLKKSGRPLAVVDLRPWN